MKDGGDLTCFAVPGGGQGMLGRWEVGLGSRGILGKDEMTCLFFDE